MKKTAVLMLIVALFAAGCATARLATGPDVYSLAEHANAVRVGVAKVADGRGTEKAGTIGACGIKIKGGDLTTLATNYLVDGLNRQMKVNVVQVKEVPADAIPQVAAQYKADYFAFAKVAELKMSSMDAIMEPVEVSCNLDLTVYDPTGKEVLKRSFPGRYQERIGLSIVDKSTGRLAEKAVQDATSNLVKDPALQDILKKK